MTKTKMKAVVLSVVASLAVSCGSSWTPPEGPSPNPDPTPTPNPSYEEIGKRYYLKDADGKDTKMWVAIAAETSPPRGSAVDVSKKDCWTPGCLEMDWERGFDGVDDELPGSINPYGKAGFLFYFSDDGINPKGAAFVNTSQGPGSTTIHYGPFLWNNPPPKYVLVVGEHGRGHTDPPEKGTTSFLLNYRAKQSFMATIAVASFLMISLL